MSKCDLYGPLLAGMPASSLQGCIHDVPIKPLVTSQKRFGTKSHYSFLLACDFSLIN